MDNSVSKIKQPEPSILAKNLQTIDVEGKKYKVVQNNPNVGVVNTPKLSRTPLRDWIEFKRQENPYTVYKVTTKGYTTKGTHVAAAAGIVLCGIISLLKIIKKK